MFDYIVKKSKANESILLQSCFSPLIIKIMADEVSFELSINSGDIEVTPTLTSRDYDFTLSATKQAWLNLRETSAPPGFQCLSTMRRTQNLIVTGNIISERFANPICISFTTATNWQMIETFFSG